MLATTKSPTLWLQGVPSVIQRLRYHFKPAICRGSLEPLKWFPNWSLGFLWALFPKLFFSIQQLECILKAYIGLYYSSAKNSLWFPIGPWPKSKSLCGRVYKFIYTFYCVHFPIWSHSSPLVVAQPHRPSNRFSDVTGALLFCRL